MAAPSLKPRSSPGLSTSRMLLVAAVAGIAAAAAVLVGWLVLEREPIQERMVVIAKESALPQQALARLPAAAPEPPPASEPSPAEPAMAPPQPTAAKTAAPAQARPATPDADELSHTFMRRQKLVQACFAKHATAEEQALPLTLHFQVAATGLVENARIQPDALSEQPLGRCLIDVAKSTRFGALAKRVSFHIPITTEKIARPGP